LNILRILNYFFVEATTSLLRSWRVSLLAISTIAMSIFIAGTFLLLSDNLDRLVQDWRREAKIIIYFESDVSAEALSRVTGVAERADWVLEVETVSATEARARFEETFPSVKDLLETWQDEPLPPSLELGFDSTLMDRDLFDEWQSTLQQDPAVVAVDDDRDWLGRLDAFIRVLRGLAAVVGASLLGAAIFTIASVIRLAAYLYRDEIAVMRLVGATEFYIRGPFYFEGLIQGVVGALAALVGLFLAFLFLNPQSSILLLGTVLIEDFLSFTAMVGLLVIGAAAGTFGAVMSLRRESLAPD
jgi:cell division transport system permease protein